MLTEYILLLDFWWSKGFPSWVQKLGIMWIMQIKDRRHRLLQFIELRRVLAILLSLEGMASYAGLFLDPTNGLGLSQDFLLPFRQKNKMEFLFSYCSLKVFFFQPQFKWFCLWKKQKEKCEQKGKKINKLF